MKPWMSDKEIDLIVSQLSPEKTMLEWGSGGSTNTFSKHVKKYYSIEHDTKWAKKMQKDLNDNVTFYHVPQSPGYSSNIPLRNIHSNLITSYTDYIKQIHNIGEEYFDVILIDGRCRKWCALEALPYLKPDSKVFIHDFYAPGREYYQDVLKYYSVEQSIKEGQSLVMLRPLKKIMHVFYRISDGGNNKDKPDYITKRNCFDNFCKYLDPRIIDMTVIADNVSEETTKYLEEKSIDGAGQPTYDIVHTNYKSGGRSFIHALELAQEQDDDIVCYFVEDDFLHTEFSSTYLLEGVLEMGADYASLYDHPDKYLDPSLGGNPQVEYGGEITRLMLGDRTHWKLTNSTVLTFAAKTKTVKRDFAIWKKCVLDSPHLGSYHAFTKLREEGRSLITSVPGRATHGETKWLTPFLDWSKYVG